MTYEGNIRRNVTITQPSKHPGIIPQDDDRVRQGDTLRVSRRQSNSSPVRRFLNVDGTPKAAKDLWKTLAGAGVSRYGEIVCFSDDPGEAAITY